jgi:hypothetical protein
MCLLPNWVLILDIIFIAVTFITIRVRENDNNNHFASNTIFILLIVILILGLFMYPDAIGISSSRTLKEGSYQIISVVLYQEDYCIILNDDHANYSPTGQTSRFYEIPKDTIVLDKTGKDRDNLITVKWQNSYQQIKLYYTREIQQVILPSMEKQKNSMPSFTEPNQYNGAMPH